MGGFRASIQLLDLVGPPYVGTHEPTSINGHSSPGRGCVIREDHARSRAMYARLGELIESILPAIESETAAPVSERVIRGEPVLLGKLGMGYGEPPRKATISQQRWRVVA